MVSVEYSEAITETLDILSHTRKEDVDKISSKLMDFLKINASKTYKPELDHTKKIKDMQLKRKTRVILAIIYKKFWCDSEKQEKINKIFKENEIRHKNELREKYNPDNLFKDRVSKIETVNNSVAMVEYKESFFSKLIKKLKIFLRLNK